MVTTEAISNRYGVKWENLEVKTFPRTRSAFSVEESGLGRFLGELKAGA